MTTQIMLYNIPRIFSPCCSAISKIKLKSAACASSRFYFFSPSRACRGRTCCSQSALTVYL